MWWTLLNYLHHICYEGFWDLYHINTINMFLRNLLCCDWVGLLMWEGVALIVFQHGKPDRNASTAPEMPMSTVRSVGCIFSCTRTENVCVRSTKKQTNKKCVSCFIGLIKWVHFLSHGQESLFLLVTFRQSTNSQYFFFFYFPPLFCLSSTGWCDDPVSLTVINTVPSHSVDFSSVPQCCL